MSLNIFSSKFRPSFLKKKHLLIFLMCFVFLSFPLFTHAGVLTDIIGTLIINPIQALLGGILILVAQLLQALLFYDGFSTQVGVVQGWEIVRDVCNMFFIVILLVIAFGTILRAEAYQFRKLFLPFVTAIILINFSKMICGLFIDFTNIITLTFMGAIGGAGLADGLLNALKVPWWTQHVPDATLSELENIKAALFSLIITFVCLIVIGAITVFIAIRTVALWILIVLSPLPFIASILPATQKYAKQWWDEFTKYVIYAPVMAFFLYLALSIFNNKETQIVKYEPGEGFAVFIIKGALPPNFSNMFLALAFLIGSLIVAQKLGIAGSGAITGTAMKMIKGGTLGVAKQISGYNRARDTWKAYRAERKSIRDERISAGARGLATLQGKTLGRFGGARERTKLEELREKGLADARKLYGSEGEKTNTELQTDYNNSRGDRRTVIAQEMLGRGLLSTDTGVNRGIVNQVMADLANAPKELQKFTDGVKKASPELAAHTVYNNFANRDDADRLLSDVSQGKIDFASVFKSFTPAMRNALDTSLGGRLGYEVATRAKSSRELNDIREELDPAEVDAIFNGLNAGQFTGATAVMRKKVALGLGRYDQIYDATNMPEFDTLIDTNKESVKKNMSNSVIGNDAFMRDHVLGNSRFRQADFEDMSKNSAINTDLNGTIERIVADYNTAGAISPNANKVRNIHASFGRSAPNLAGVQTCALEMTYAGRTGELETAIRNTNVSADNVAKINATELNDNSLLQEMGFAFTVPQMSTIVNKNRAMAEKIQEELQIIATNINHVRQADARDILDDLRNRRILVV